MLAGYADTCRRLGVERRRLVATSATRDAADRQAFLDGVRDLLGVDAEVLTGQAEAAATYRGATADLPGDQPTLVVDIGGGSTELICGHGAAADAMVSLDIGCVRGCSSATSTATRRPPGRWPRSGRRGRPPAPRPRGARPGGRLPGRRGRGHGHHRHRARARPRRLRPAPHPPGDVDAAEVAAVAGKLAAMTVAERAALPVMARGREDVIAAGALLLDELIRMFHLRSVIASEADILDGVLLGLAKDPMAAESQAAPAQADDQAPRYRVAAVERMTRIPASTLRSWERRYGWPRPFRAASGQRLYSDDVAVIRFLDRRRVEGMSMSQAAALLRAAPAVEDHDPRLLDRLVAALRAFDEAAAERAFAAAEALLGTEGVATGVVPAAIAAAAVPGHGSGSGQDGTPVEVEHFASNFLRRQVLRLLDGQPPAMGRPVLVGCGPDEQHELGALLLTLLLRARGHRVVYLGARVPGPAMERAAALDPAGVVVSLTMPESLERAVTWTRDNRRWPRHAPASWWAGPAVAAAPDLAARSPATCWTAPSTTAWPPSTPWPAAAEPTVPWPDDGPRRWPPCGNGSGARWWSPATRGTTGRGPSGTRPPTPGRPSSPARRWTTWSRPSASPASGSCRSPCAAAGTATRVLDLRRRHRDRPVADGRGPGRPGPPHGHGGRRRPARGARPPGPGVRAGLPDRARLPHRVGGLTLGGGVGRLAHGLTVDNLAAVELVTAEGERVRADAGGEPELFWGLRGAGANFGIATSFELRLHPVGPLVLAGIAVYPVERAREVAAAFGAHGRRPRRGHGRAGLVRGPARPAVPAGGGRPPGGGGQRHPRRPAGRRRA